MSCVVGLIVMVGLLSGSAGIGDLPLSWGGRGCGSSVGVACAVFAPDRVASFVKDGIAVASALAHAALACARMTLRLCEAGSTCARVLFTDGVSPSLAAVPIRIAHRACPSPEATMEVTAARGHTPLRCCPMEA